MGDKAIWYNAKNNNWIIGDISFVGSGKARFFAENEFGGLTDSENKWMFVNDEWEEAPPNDIIVQSSCKYS